ILSPADFGLVAMAGAVTAFVGLFTDLGLSAATVQRAHIDQDLVSTLFFANVAMGLLCMAVATATAPLAALLFHHCRVTQVILALSVGFPMAALGSQHGALLQRNMRWGALQWCGLAAQSIAAIATITLAWRGGIGYWALVVQGWVGATAQTILY